MDSFVGISIPQKGDLTQVLTLLTWSQLVFSGSLPQCCWLWATLWQMPTSMGNKENPIVTFAWMLLHISIWLMRLRLHHPSQASKMKYISKLYQPQRSDNYTSSLMGERYCFPELRGMYHKMFHDVSELFHVFLQNLFVMSGQKEWDYWNGK